MLFSMLILMLFGRSSWVISGIGMEGAGRLSSLEPVRPLVSGLNYPTGGPFPQNKCHLGPGQCMVPEYIASFASMAKSD